MAPVGRAEPGTLRIPGRLKSSIKTRMTPTGGEWYSSAPHALPIEKGASPHEITGNPFLRFPNRTAARKQAVTGKSAKMIVTRSVNHPGNKAQPFLRPAFEIVKGRVTSYMKKYL
jgi:hypothetical protein